MQVTVRHVPEGSTCEGKEFGLLPAGSTGPGVDKQGQTVVRGWLHSPPEYLNKWLFPAYGSIIVLLLPYNHPFRSIFNTCLVLDLYSLAEKKINDNCKALVMMVRSLTAVHTPLWRSVLGYHPLQWVLRIHPFQAFIVYLWIPNVGRIRDAFLQKVLIQSNVLGVY